MFMDTVKKLCNAIIAQAADDYRVQYRDFLKDPSEAKVRYLLLNRRYFENDCCGMTSIGTYIVERIEREVREGFNQESLGRADGLIVGVCGKAAGAA